MVQRLAGLSNLLLSACGVAVVVAAAVVLARAAIDVQAGTGVLALLFVVPPIVGSWYGGTALGLFSAGLGSVAGGLVLTGWGAFDGGSPVLVLSALLLVGSAIALLRGRGRPADRPAEAAESFASAGEAALRASEERFRLLSDSIHDIVTLLDADGRVLFVSASVRDRLGWRAEELVGTLAFDLTHPDDRSVALEQWRARCTGAEVAPFTWRCRARDGSWRWLETTSSLRADPGQPVRVLCTSRDVTDRKALEAQLRQALRMEAIGRLAGGVAHDFNNLLTVILGYASTLEEALGGDGGLARDAREIRAAAERASRLTQQLLAFSRQQVLQPRDVDLNGVITQLTSMLERIVGAHVRLDLALDDRAFPVLVDPGQVEQIIMNLVVNARDAMPGGGSITISTCAVSLASPDVVQGVQVPAGDWTVCAVADSGHGVRPELLRRIFEPFFTTKPIGQGTGLGLSMVYGIVKQSSGYIFCDSAVGAGTVMRVYLPRAPVPAAQGSPQPPSSSSGRGTVLLVDDDASVRGLLTSVLRARGFQVVEAASGAEALDLLPAVGQVDVVVSDLLMPGMSGVELADRIRAGRPGSAVLFVSGHADDLLKPDALPPGTAFLQKPFTPDALVSRLVALVDAGRTRPGR